MKKGHKTPITEQHISDRFWSKIEIKTEEECWNWKEGTNKRGYGRFHIPSTDNGVSLAHRFAYALVNGPIPDEDCVLHSCDNPPCCNPRHLSLGDRIKNNDEMRERGRDSKPPLHMGETHPRSVLTNDQVRSIKNDKRAARHLAQELGVSLDTIYRVRQGKSYKNV